MNYLDKSTEHCQPCEFYFMDDDDPYPHCCPDCEGLRYFCANCHKDHHKNGWESCGITEAKKACRHPSCRAAIAAAELEEGKG